MISRGYLVGKIIDDLALLNQKILFRNKIGLLDLTKISEDFFKEILNIIYDYNLINLNSIRSNEPGIDLGDKNKKIAFQITSEKTSDKINETLKKISDENREDYESFKILLIAKKQTSYTIKEELALSNNFDLHRDLLDLENLIKEISILDETRLDTLYNYFQKAFRDIIVELEVMDADGNFENSIFNTIEKIPSTPPNNILRYIDFNNGINEDINKFIETYNLLSSIPRTQRELIALIAERGYFDDSRLRYKISCVKLANLMNISEKKLFNNMAYLEEEKIIWFSAEVDEHERPCYKYHIMHEYLNLYLNFLIESKFSLRKNFIAMDFSILEKN